MSKDSCNFFVNNLLITFIDVFTAYFTCNNLKLIDEIYIIKEA